ncbi:MAG: glycosyltransferase [Anaerolineae bacterium]|nr:glycosyltransferase [Anaerolineae bacterium]
MPKISVITVVRNGARYLAQALDSILQQNYAPLQMIIVDGQSTDGTDRIARSYPGVLYIEQPTLGLARARNLGVRHADGEFIAFLDHDDIWLPDKLIQQVGFMLQHPTIAWSTTWFTWFADNIDELSPVHRKRLFTLQTAPTPSALVARRTAFVENGLFDEDLTVACDSAWFARARQRGLPHAQIPRVLLRKRLHTANLSLQVGRYRAEWLQVLHSLRHVHR